MSTKKQRLKLIKSIQKRRKQLSRIETDSEPSSFHYFHEGNANQDHITILSQAGFIEYSQDDIGQQIFIENLKSELTITIQNEYSYAKSKNLDYLYVYDINDVNELTIEEIRIAWENRYFLCGSIDAAAEMLSILKYIDSDDDEPFYPYTNYLDSDEITSLENHIDRIKPFDDIITKEYIPHNETLSSNEINPELSLKEIWIDRIETIVNLDKDHLKHIWKNVLEHCESIEIASAIYARLRFVQGFDKVERDWVFYINSPSISQLKDKLPSENTITQFNEISTLLVDKKDKSLRYTTNRSNQTDFRMSLITRYSGTCCITNCSELTIIEAAHIIPYMGNHSDLTDNGLLLRVDIHRLFDKYLITIDSDSHKVIVSDNMSDEYYRSFNGKEIYIQRTSDAFLKKHNDEFKKNITKT